MKYYTTGDKWILNPKGYDHSDPTVLNKQASSYIDKYAKDSVFNKAAKSHYDSLGGISHYTQGWKRYNADR